MIEYLDCWLYVFSDPAVNAIWWTTLIVSGVLVRAGVIGYVTRRSPKARQQDEEFWFDPVTMGLRFLETMTDGRHPTSRIPVERPVIIVKRRRRVKAEAV